MKTTYKVETKTDNVRGTGKSKTVTVSNLAGKVAANQASATSLARAFEPIFGTEAKTNQVKDVTEETYDTSEA